MKKYFFLPLLTALLATACSDTWDNHYKETEETINNSTIYVVDANLTDYLASEPSLKEMYNLMNKTGIVDQIKNRDQLFTVVAPVSAVSNSTGSAATSLINEGDDSAYVAKTYISDVSLSPSNIKDGDRLLMWSGKYLNITKTATDGENPDIQFNNAKAVKIVKLNDGYLYMVNEPVTSPKSMYEIIEGLGDNYSLFRNMVLSRNKRIFDKAASTPVGVDAQGRTVYDSVFTMKAPYFETGTFDLLSENTQATMFIPSNAVIKQAIEQAKANLQNWGLERADSVLTNWIVQASFYDHKLTPEELSDADNPDVFSIFKQQWRTTVQQLNLSRPVNMSNGVAYYVTKMKIPTNVLIYRLKDFFYYYESLTDAEKNQYYVTNNLLFSKVDVPAYHSGWPAAGFPRIDYKTLRFTLEDATQLNYTFSFTPFIYQAVGSTEHITRPYKVPAGSYDVFFGLEQDKKGNLGDINIFINDEKVGTITASQLSSTTFHYDRAGGGYPEGYDVSTASKAGVSKARNYGRDGGQVGTITLTGDAKPIVIRFEASGSKLTKATFFHWCLRPTKDCY